MLHFTLLRVHLCNSFIGGSCASEQLLLPPLHDSKQGNTINVRAILEVTQRALVVKNSYPGRSTGSEWSTPPCFLKKDTSSNLEAMPPGHPESPNTTPSRGICGRNRFWRGAVTASEQGWGLQTGHMSEVLQAMVCAPYSVAWRKRKVHSRSHKARARDPERPQQKLCSGTPPSDVSMPGSSWDISPKCQDDNVKPHTQRRKACPKIQNKDPFKFKKKKKTVWLRLQIPVSPYSSCCLDQIPDLNAHSFSQYTVGLWGDSVLGPWMETV